MNKRQFVSLAAASAGSFILGALANYRSFTDDLLSKDKEFILIVSENTVFELTGALAKAYQDKNNKIRCTIKNGSSLEAIIAAKLGAIDLAAITRDLSDEEYNADSYNYLLARSSVSIIVNPKNSVRNLTVKQVQALFSGGIKNWKAVSGMDAPVNVMSRDSASSTRQYLEDIVLNGRAYSSRAREFSDAKAMCEAVAGDINAIGFVAAKDAKGLANVKRLAISNILATKATVLSGRYPLSRSFYLLLAGKNIGPKKDFVDFALSAAGQKIVEELMPVC